MTGQRASVLIVMSDDELARTICSYLGRNGIDASETTSLYDAIRHLTTSTPDMILLERFLNEDQDSLDWLIALSHELEMERISVAMLSPSPPTPEDKRRARDVGFVFFIPRPKARTADLKNLARIVNRAFDARIALDQASETQTSADDPEPPPAESAPSSEPRREKPEPRARPRRPTPSPASVQPQGSPRPSWSVQFQNKDRLQADCATVPEAQAPSAPPKDARKAHALPRSAPPKKPGGSLPADFTFKPRRIPHSGSLKDFSMPELLSSALYRSASGKLTISHGAVTSTIFILGGYPVYAESNQVSETLGEQLRRSGRLSPVEHENVLERMRATGQKMGQLLMRDGLMTPIELQAALTTNIKNKIITSFQWKSGDFRFEEHTGFGDRDYSFSMTTARLVIDGVTTHGDLELLSRYLPINPTAQLYLLENPLWESGDISFTDREIDLQEHIEAELPIDLMLKKSGEDPAFVWNLLLALYLLKLVGFRSEPYTSEESNSSDSNKKRITVIPRRKTKPPNARQISAEAERMETSDYFKILGVSREATTADIHQAFREKIKPYQHEVLARVSVSERDSAIAVQRQITVAYITLSDVDKRELYLDKILGRTRPRTEPAPGVRASRQPANRYDSSTAQLGSRPRQAKAERESVIPTVTPPKREVSNKNPRELLIEARASLKKRRAQEAALTMREAVSLDPENAVLIAWGGWVLFWANPENNAAVAKKQIMSAIKKDATIVEPPLFLARIFVFEGEYEAANSYYRTAAKKEHAPPVFIKEAADYQQELSTARVEARQAGLRLVDFMEEEPGVLFRRWVLSD